MDLSTQLRLLSTLHGYITDLPAKLIEYGVTSQSGIEDLTNQWAKQLKQLISGSTEHAQTQKKMIKSLQLEIDFIKNMYFTSNSDFKKCEKLYLNAVSEVDAVKLQNQHNTEYLNSIIKTHESQIANLVNENRVAMAIDDEDENKASSNLQNLLKVIYPNDNSTDIDVINTKLNIYIQNAIAQNNITSDLQNIIAQLQTQVDDERTTNSKQLQTLVDRCNDKLTQAKNIIITDNQSDFDDAQLSLISILSNELDTDGVWHEIMSYPKTPNVDSNDIDMSNNTDVESNEVLYDTQLIPETPGRGVDLFDNVGISFNTQIPPSEFTPQFNTQSSPSKTIPQSDSLLDLDEIREGVRTSPYDRKQSKTNNKKKKELNNNKNNNNKIKKNNNLI